MADTPGEDLSHGAVWQIDELQAVAENALDAIIVIDSNDEVQFWNEAATELFGFSKTEAVGNRAHEMIVPERYRDRYEPGFEEFRETGAGPILEQTREMWAKTKAEAEIPVELSVNSYERNGDWFAVAVVRDISDRREREQELLNYQHAVEHSTDLLGAANTDYEVLFTNERYRRYHGLENEAVRGRKLPDLFPERFDQIKPYFDRTLEGEAVRYETERPGPGGEGRTLDVRYYPLYDDEDDIAGGVASMRDITERKAFEEQLESQRDDLEVLNQVVRHDVRNDLQLVTAYAGLLEDHVDEDAAEYLSRIKESGENAIDLTHTAGELAEAMRSTGQKRRPVSLKNLLESEIDQAQSANPNAIIQSTDHIPDLTVMAGELLDSVFRNLLTNAVVHNDDPVPTVTVSVDPGEEFVQVAIEDNGPGVPDVRKTEIFGKGEKGLDSPGTGLGLYLVSTLIDTFDGDVWVEDGEPSGARFVVELERTETGSAEH